MFNSRFLALTALFFLVFSLLSVRPARSAPLPVVNPPTPALVTSSGWPVGAVGTSPTWGYNVTTVPNGSPVMVQPQVTVTSPWQPVAVATGTGVSIPVPQTYTVPSSPSAAPVPGIPSSPSASVVATVNAGAGGAGSTAASMTKKAFGAGAVAAGAMVAAKFVPYVGTALVVGQVGYELYKAFVADGVVVNPDGSVGVGGGYVWNGSNGTTATSPEEYCGRFGMGAWYYSPIWVGCTDAAHPAGGANYPVFVSRGAPAAPRPYTDADLISAIDRLTANVNVAADAINYSMSRGVPIPDGLPITNSVPSVSLKGIPDLTSSSTDATGNTTNTYSQPSAKVDLPTKTGDNPTISTGSTATTTVNNNTTNTTNTFNPPVVVPSISAGTSGNIPKPNDLCVDHPDIFACSNDANTGDVPDVALTNKDVNVSITPETMSTNFVCPAPISFVNTFGKMEVWDVFTPICNFSAMLKPIILAFAWLAAGLIVFVGRSQNE